MRQFPESWSAAEPLHGARMATCPECEFDDIDTADHEEGDTLSCPECGKNLVLLGADELDFADDEDDIDNEDDINDAGDAGDEDDEDDEDEEEE